VAVVVNEIGDFNLDGRVIEGTNVEKMVELSNGCICCSISYQFGYAMQEIVETTRPELIIIETTGAADPLPLVDEVKSIGLRVDGVITVVDGEHARRIWRQSRTARSQIAAADFLVLNKCDLLTEGERGRTERFLRRRNRRALFVPTAFGRVKTDLLFATGARTYRAAALRAATEQVDRNHLEEDAIQAFTYETAAPLDRSRFERFLRRLPPDLYRAKGILRFAHDGAGSIFNYTCGRYDIDWFLGAGDLPAKSQAVFIGRHLLREKDEILGHLAECEVAGAVPAQTPTPIAGG
jgi:G3E family GTPase